VTILAFTNLELLIFAVKNLDAGERIAINGGGSNSGHSLWRKVISQFNAFYGVWAGTSNRLPYYPWNLDDIDISWNDIAAYVAEDENKYGLIISLIETYKEESHNYLKKFEVNVLDKKLSPLDPTVEVILSTIHAAKGLEWDRVMIIDETLKDISTFEDKGGLDWLPYVDDYNVWYVALTRAKKVLSVPSKYMTLVNDMRITARLYRCLAKQMDVSDDDFVIGGKVRSVETIQAIYSKVAEVWVAEREAEGGLWINGTNYTA
jgi:superfamily I DNA/RNA helicase